MPRKMKLLAVALAVCAGCVAGQGAEDDANNGLVLESKVPLGNVRGRIDHLAVDLGRKRLFVAELGNGSVGVVDLAAGKLLRRELGREARDSPL